MTTTGPENPVASEGATDALAGADEPPRAGLPHQVPPHQAPRPKRRLSRLTARILAINLFAVAILFVGVLHLDRYQNSLIQAELKALSGQAGIFARAIADVAVERELAQSNRLSIDGVRRMLRRNGDAVSTRIRVFNEHGHLIGDSLVMGRPGGLVKIRPLPPPNQDPFDRMFAQMYDQLFNWMPRRGSMPMYRERAVQEAEHYQEVMRALAGRAERTVRSTDEGGMLLSVAVPVQSYKKVLGALMFSIEGKEIDEAVRLVRFEILGVFAIVFAVTVALSLYLARTITRPVQRLAHAAEQVRSSRNRQHQIPDFSNRSDEIGDLAVAMREMTEALWQRMDAIERFAADVAHEIKNPLTSVRSAVETAARISDPEKQQQLMAIILDDVQRLDRLITDISEASRLDAELSRDEAELVDLGAMLSTVTDLHSDVGAERGASQGAVTLQTDVAANTRLLVNGSETRLFQILRNLIENATGFSPPGGVIRLGARIEGDNVLITVEDDGPGLPPGKLEAVFERFYSERPEAEKFGTHSGLGLSICRQIVQAQGGRIWAENRTDASGVVTGARFFVRLPRILGDA